MTNFERDPNNIEYSADIVIALSRAAAYASHSLTNGQAAPSHPMTQAETGFLHALVANQLTHLQFERGDPAKVAQYALVSRLQPHENLPRFTRQLLDEYRQQQNSAAIFTRLTRSLLPFAEPLGGFGLDNLRRDYEIRGKRDIEGVAEELDARFAEQRPHPKTAFVHQIRHVLSQRLLETM